MCQISHDMVWYIICGDTSTTILSMQYHLGKQLLRNNISWRSENFIWLLLAASLLRPTLAASVSSGSSGPRCAKQRDHINFGLTVLDCAHFLLPHTFIYMAPEDKQSVFFSSVISGSMPIWKNRQKTLRVHFSLVVFHDNWQFHAFWDAASWNIGSFWVTNMRDSLQDNLLAMRTRHDFPCFGL